MKKQTDDREVSGFDRKLRNPLYLFVMAALAICFGAWFIFLQSFNAPVERTDALAYSGPFGRLESGHNYCSLYFLDGSCYSLYPHTQTNDFKDTIRDLPAGTELSILVNPNNDYVIEILAGDRELMNFEQSQVAIIRNGYGYIGIGIFACVAGVFFVVYYFLERAGKRREEQRQAVQKRAGDLRPADLDVKCRILLEASMSGYRICYRRVRSTNELVVNGYVYDELKAVLEFDHKLVAEVGGHTIAAGLKGEYSFIEFDGKVIKREQRLI